MGREENEKVVGRYKKIINRKIFNGHNLLGIVMRMC